MRTPEPGAWTDIGKLTAIAAYVEAYHHRPHSGLGYRTPEEVRKTWEDAQESETSTKSAA